MSAHEIFDCFENLKKALIDYGEWDEDPEYGSVDFTVSEGVFFFSIEDWEFSIDECLTVEAAHEAILRHVKADQETRKKIEELDAARERQLYEELRKKFEGA